MATLVNTRDLILQSEVSRYTLDLPVISIVPSIESDLWSSAAGVQLLTVGDGKVGNKVRRSVANTDSIFSFNGFFQLDRARTYRTRFWARASTNATGVLYHSLRQFLPNGNLGPVNGGRSPYKPNNVQPSAAQNWTEFTHVWTSADWQAGVTQLKPDFLLNYGAGSAVLGYWEIQGYEVVDETAAEEARILANNAQLAANNAQTTANNAATDAALANAEIANAVSDNILSKGEKSAEILRYTTIVDERLGIFNQATTLGITTEKTAYQSAYDALVNYLAGLSGWNNVAVNTTIVGTTYRSMWNDYYVKRQTLLDKSTAIASTLANWATGLTGRPTDAELLNSAIVIGGRNLLPGSSNGTGWSYTGYSGTEFWRTASSVGETDYIYSTYATLPPNAQVTLSFESMQDGAVSGTPDLFILADNYPTSGAIVSATYPASTVWTKNTLVITTTAGFLNNPARVRFDHNGSPGGVARTYRVRNVKLEVGNKGTTYTPSPEDVAADASAKVAVAQQAADVANLELGRIASDSVLSRGEKPAVVKEWTAISDEVTPLVNQAAALVVSSTAFTNAKTALDNHLNSLSPVWSDVTTDTSINAVNFRNAFNAYYVEKIKLLNAINAKAATLATWSSVSGTGRPADNASSDVTLVGRGVTVIGNTATLEIATAGWTADAYSLESYTGGAYASFSFSTVAAGQGIMAGLNSDPALDSNFTGIDWAVHFENGNVRVYESGVAAGGGSGTIYTNGTPSDIFTVIYNNVKVIYQKNGVTFRETTTSAGQRLFFDSSFVGGAISIKGIKFGPFSANDFNSIGGVNKPENNATVGANRTNLNVTLPGDNLVRNSGFERSIDNLFSIYNNDPVNEPATLSYVAGRTGGQAVMISWTPNHFASKGLIFNVVGGWQPGKTYVVSFYAKTTSLVGGVGTFLGWNTSPVSSDTLTNPILSMEWQRYAFRITWGTAVEVNGTTYVSLGGGPNAGNIWFDDMMVTEGDVLAAWYPSTIDAQAVADAANLAITNISSDNVLSKGEKADVILRIAEMDGEFNDIIAKADAVSVNRDLYFTSKVNLNSYLAGLSPAWNDTTTDTTIVGSTFRSTFSEYYNRRQLLLNAIAAKAATTATWGTVSGTGRPEDNATVGANATNLQVGIGGINLLDNSLPTSAAGFTHGGTTTQTPEGNTILFVAGTAPYVDTFARYSPDFKGCAYLHFITTPLTGTTHDTYKNGEASRNAVVAGKRYEFSAALSLHRCEGAVVLAWYNSAGTHLGESISARMPANFADSFANTIPRAFVFATAPPTAVTAMVFVRTFYLGQVDPYNFFSQFYFGEALPAQTVPSPWSASTALLTTGLVAARAQADAANATLAAIASDSILHRSEKPAVAKEWEAIDAEIAGLVNQASALAVSSVALTEAKIALANYLVGLTPGWSDTTTDTTINAVAFRNAWNNYYTAKINLLNAFAQRSSERSTWSGTTGAGKPSDNASSDITLIGRGCSINGNTATKTAAGGGWDADAYSVESFTAGAYVTVTVPATAGGSLMFGLNSDPTFDASYASLDYAIYLVGATVYVYESNAQVGPGYTTFVAGDVFNVIYDNVNIIYQKNGVTFHFHSVGAGQRLHFDSSFVEQGLSLKNIRFGPFSPNDFNSIGGPNKPENNATVGGTLGVNIGGQITSGNVASLIANAAITDTQLANNTFNISITGVLDTTKANTLFEVGIGTLTASVTGPTTYTILWSALTLGTDPDGNTGLIAAGTPTSASSLITAKVSASNTAVQGTITLLVIDDRGRSRSAVRTFSVQFGTPQ